MTRRSQGLTTDPDRAHSPAHHALDHRSIPDLSDRTYIVTGANSGIGYEAARVLAERGARVVLACRTESKARDALDEIWRARSDARAEFGALDLASLKSVRRRRGRWRGASLRASTGW